MHSRLATFNPLLSKNIIEKKHKFVSFLVQGEVSYTVMIPATKNYKVIAHFENQMLGSCIMEGFIRQGAESFPIRMTLTGRYTCDSNCFVEGLVNGSDSLQLSAGLATIVFTGITSINVSLVSKHPSSEIFEQTYTITYSTIINVRATL